MGVSPGSNRCVEVRNPGQLDGDEFPSHSDEEPSDGNLAFFMSASAGWGDDYRPEPDAVRQIRDGEGSFGHRGIDDMFDEESEAARADAVDEEESRGIARTRSSRNADRHPYSTGGLDEY